MQDYPRHYPRKSYSRKSLAAVLATFGLPAAILAWILYPLFGHERGSRAISCVSNLKMQALGVLMYAQDYDNTLPAASEWMDTVYPYIKDDRIFRCPTLVDEYRGPAEFVYGYAYHSRLSKAKVSALAEPANTVLTYDSIAETRDATDPFTSLPNPGRHFGGNNVSFIDGHVKWKDMHGIRELQEQMQMLNLLGSSPTRIATEHNSVFERK